MRDIIFIFRRKSMTITPYLYAQPYFFNNDEPYNDRFVLEFLDHNQIELLT